MSACCGAADAEAVHEAPRAPATSRARAAAGWLLPSATLALIPKCPACIAAYIASIAYFTTRQLSRAKDGRYFKRIAAAAPIL